MRRDVTILSVVLLILSAAGALVAQVPASATWALTDPNAGGTGQTVATSGLVNAADENLVNSEINGYTGYNNSQRVRIKGNSWPAGLTTQIDTVYVEFAVTPKAGNKMTVESLSLDLGCHSLNNMKANVWYSTDPAFLNPVQVSYQTADTVNNYLPRNTTNTVQTITAQPFQVVNQGETFFLRVYFWVDQNASVATGKYLTIQNVVIGGITETAPLPASATWALTDPNTGGTGQSVATTGKVNAAYEHLVNAEINGYTGFNSSQRVRIIGNSWPAGLTTQIDTVYVEFAVSPKLGARLRVESLSLDLGCHSLNNMKANVWYSTDPAFLDPIQVAYQTADTVNNYLPRNTSNTAQTVTAQPNVLVDQGQTFYLRVYFWVDQNASVATGKYMTIQNVVIGGTTESAPLLSSAAWALTDPNTGGTGKTVATAGKVTAAEEKLVNTEINGYTGFNNSQRVRIKGNSWPAGLTAQIDTVYVEFAVSPKAGARFTVQTLSLDLGCHSLNNMKANVWYSTDPAFLNPVQVVYQTADTVNNYLPRNTTNTVQTVTAQPNLVVEADQTFYLRVYPWVDQNASIATGKYLTIQNVLISGQTEGGADFELPSIATQPVSYISTTFAASGGTIPSDGGAPVTARGVCWSTTTAPTTVDAKTSDGAGSGSFVSQVTGLTAGVTYYLRAYATNDAGTAYGEEFSFKTLDSLMAPTVTTAQVSDVMVKTAKGGGTVTEWGGSDVIARGICWNLTGDPTIADNKSESGTGIGSFTASIFPLTESTVYYVRAYATNSTGTGYGRVESFTTQAPAPAVFKVVAQDGSGDYTTVQAAFNDVPDFYTGMWCIYVKAGTYKEKLLLAQNKTNVVLRGESALTTILTYDDYAGKPGVGGTSNCYSTAIEADDFTAMDITFQNTVKNDGSAPDQQAVALRVNGDRGAYYNCRLLGYQDTYYAWGGHGTVRTYMKECYIEGSVDFIFGRNINVFDNCHIHVNRQNGCITAPSTDAASRFGLVFMDCKITADSVGFNGVPITSIHLGRPWQGRPRCVYLRCEAPATLNPEGWTVMTTGLNPFFAEYHCFGPGSNFFGRINGGIQLSGAEAAEYTIANIFARTSNPSFGYDWLPEKPVFTDVEWSKGPESLPTVYELSQNYPNPFNPVTTIHYALPNPGKVRIIVYNLLGAKVATLVDGPQAAGRHTVRFDALHLGSGAYFYRIEADDFQQTKKMLLLK